MLRLRGKLDQTVLFVTHDVEEALRLADRIVVMNAGRVVQYDTPLAILSSPADEFVRDLTGGDDVLRRLGVVRVASAMREVGGREAAGPAVGSDESVRDALSALLGTGADALTVLADGRAVGAVTLDDIRRIAVGRRA